MSQTESDGTSPSASVSSMKEEGSSRWLDRLNDIDERISRPIFRTGLPRWLEFCYSIPACFFGTSFSAVAGPSWIALLSLSQVPRDDRLASCVSSVDDLDRAVLALKCLAYSTTAVYVAAWGLLQIGGRHGVMMKLLWNGLVYELSLPFNVCALACLLLGLSKNADETACGLGPEHAPGGIYSLAMYPLFLWSPLFAFMDCVKKATHRKRPALKALERGEDWIERKKFPLMPQLLAKYNGHASFPSGDAMIAAMFAIPISNVPDLDGSGRFSTLAWTIVFLSASGRMYVLAHHFSDVVGGVAIPVLAHLATTSLGFGIYDMEWWHPLLARAPFLTHYLWKKNREKQSKDIANAKSE